MKWKAWFFLLLLLWVSYSKLIPFVDYQINYSYIIAELCEQREMTNNTCNGQCYLSKKLAENTQKAEEMQLVQVTWEVLVYIPSVKTDFKQQWVNFEYQEFGPFFIKESIIDPPFLPPEGMLT